MSTMRTAALVFAACALAAAAALHAPTPAAGGPGLRVQIGAVVLVAALAPDGPSLALRFAAPDDTGGR